MDAKITTVRPREEDWLGRAIATQLELEGVWQSLEGGEERYRMSPLSPHSLDNEDAGSGGGGGVRVVCLSDTHSMQSSIEFRIPDGNIRISISLIEPNPPRGYPHTRRGLHQIRPGIGSCSVQLLAWHLAPQSKR